MGSCSSITLVLVTLNILVCTTTTTVISGLAVAAPPPAANTPTAPTSQPDALAEAFLQPHNKARADVGVEALKWNTELAKDASKLVRYQRDKKECKFDVSSLFRDKYGMNQGLSGGIVETPGEAVKHWVDEKEYYNHENNTCAPSHENVCGVYTQVVWNSTLELGCAQARCVKERSTLTICLYSPAGNIVGERPY